MRLIKEIGRNPHIDWIAILVILFILTVSFIYLSFALYNEVITGSIQASAEKSAVKRLNEKALSSVLDRFAEREEMSKKARAGYSGATDPSI